MESNKLYNQFLELLKNNSEDEAINVVPVWETLSHKLGCTSEGFPLFFIACDNDDNDSDINLDLFKVTFNNLCRLYDVTSGCIVDKKYSIIRLNSSNPELQRYFLEVVSIILKKLPPKPHTGTLKNEIAKVISLFIAAPKVSNDIIQGLWAELFVIHKSYNPTYLIQAWHATKNDKYDFNDGVDKLEVKSTSGTERVHNFSLEQLMPNQGSNLLVASMFVSETGLGCSINDLVDMIVAKLPAASEVVLKLKEQVLATLGVKQLDAYQKTYDYKQAEDTYNLYDYHDIPSIQGYIPKEVTKVHFRSDLTDIPTIFDKEYETTSKLFGCIWQKNSTPEEIQ